MTSIFQVCLCTRSHKNMCKTLEDKNNKRNIIWDGKAVSS